MKQIATFEAHVEDIDKTVNHAVKDITRNGDPIIVIDDIRIIPTHNGKIYLIQIIYDDSSLDIND